MVKMLQDTTRVALPMHLHFEPVQYIVRGYREPDGYEKKAPFDLVLNVFMTGAGTATVFAARGDMNRPTRAALCSDLAARGVHTARVVRHGKMKEISTGLKQ